MDKHIPLVVYRDGKRYIVGTVIMADEITGNAYFNSQEPYGVALAKDFKVGLDRPVGIHIQQTMTEIVVRARGKFPWVAVYPRRRG